MSVALQQANQAYHCGEVPVGCVITHPSVGFVVSHNQCEEKMDATQHAEVVAINKMAKLLNSYRLKHCTLYVTLEPCVQCCGAIVLARISQVIYGAPEPKSGGAKSLFNILDCGRLNHKCGVHGGLLEARSASILKKFFKEKRQPSKGLSESCKPE